METCKICGMSYKNTKSLGKHIAGTHKYSMVDYYVNVLGNPVGLCSCGNLTKFRNIAIGFSKHCSAKCSYNDSDVTSKRNNTNIARYGKKNAVESELVREKIKNTNLSRFGGISPMCSDIIRDRAKESIRDKYGVDSVLSLNDIREKATQTMIKKYGVNPLSSEIISIKRKTTSLAKYGVSHPMLNESVKEKLKNTSIDRYGVEHPMMSGIVKDKVKQTNLMRYGVEYIPQSIGFMDRVRSTNMSRYGVNYQIHNPLAVEKMKTTNIARYGVEYAVAANETKAKKIRTLIDRYGVDNSMKDPLIREKTKLTNIQKYGVPYIILRDDSKISRSNNNRKKLITKYSDMLESSNCTFEEINDDGFISYKCKECGSLNTESYQFIKKCRLDMSVTPCVTCEPKRPISSFSERELGEFITSLGYKISHSDRTKISPQELDIVIEDKSIAIEYNGLHYHSELYKSDNYHVNKSDLCLSRGIQLVHVFEDDWLYKKDIVKSRLMSMLGVSPRIIYARKCKVRMVTSNDAKIFLENNHLQSSCQAKYRYGLYFGDELVSLMTFGKSRFEKDTIELLRYCNLLNTTVVGGAGKLFKYFIDNNDIDRVVSYADRCWSVGNLYEKIGFSLVATTSPNYYYVIGDERHNRMHYQKHKLVSEGFDKSKTEREIMLDRNIYRIYDSGNLKYEWVKP